MEPEVVVSTLADLSAERSSDVLLFEALSRRFYANAAEFFPPQIDAVVTSFAGLRYADESLLRGFAGRVQDIASDASPRRLVRMLRHGAALQLRRDAWLGAVLPQLREQLPNLREGVPTVLESLSALRCEDEVLAQLLLHQGLIVAEELGPAYTIGLFEKWSRFGLRQEDVERQALELATGGGCDQLHVRDRLNLLAGLQRYSDSAFVEARAGVERQLEAQLKGTAPSKSAATFGERQAGDDAVDCLSWMLRLSLRSPALWRSCADNVQVAMQGRPFARQQLPTALHALAALSGEEAEERALVAALLASPDTRKSASVHSAWQATLLLRAACLIRPPSGEDGSTIPWRDLLQRATRTARQLSLPERRVLAESVQSLRGSGLPGADGAIAELRALPTAALQPLAGDEECEDVADIGGRALAVTSEAKRRGDLFLRHGDTFAAPPAKKGEKQAAAVALTQSCRLAVRAMEAQGWKVAVRA